MKALEKDRNRRYETANGLAADLRRYLDDEPVQACPPSAGYRLRKLVRRHKVAISTVLLVAAVLVTGTVFSTWQAIRAGRAQSLADRRLVAETSARDNAIAAQKLAKQNEQRAQEQTVLAQRRFYASQINLASQAFQAGSPARTLELLEGLRPRFDEMELRTFEWYYLWGLCRSPHRFTLRGHREGYYVAFSPDGKTLAWQGGSGVKIGEVATGLEWATLEGDVACWCVAFSPDGKTLAGAIASMPDWREGLGQVKLWDLHTGRERTTLYGPKGQVRRLAFSPDGKTLATGSEGGFLRLWDVVTQQEQATTQAHTAPVIALAFAPDGKTLATASAWGDALVKLWDLATRSPRAAREFSGAASLAFSPDGKTLATGGSEGVRLWDITTGKLRATRNGPPGGKIFSVAFSPDGKNLAFGTRARSLHLWSPRTNQERVFPNLGAVYDVAFSPDGKTLASTCGDATVKLWDLAPSEEPTKLYPTAAAICLAFSPDSKSIASGNEDGNVNVWKTPTGQSRAILKGHTEGANSVRWGPDGQTLASASDDRTVKLWNGLTGGEPMTLRGFSGPLHSVAFSPNGRTLAAGTYGDHNSPQPNGEITVWDLAKGPPHAALEPRAVHGGVHALAFSPDGKTLAAGTKFGWVRLWDAATGQERQPIQEQLGASIHLLSLGFCPDGNLLATGDSEGRVTLFAGATRQSRASLKGHTGPIRSVTFFQDARTLVTGSEDGTVKLWDVDTGQERLTIQGQNYAALAPDGNTMATISSDGSVKLWRTATDKEATAKKTELDPDDPESPVANAKRGDRLQTLGSSQEAEQAYRTALTRLEELAAEFPNDQAYRENIARNDLALGSLLSGESRLPEAQQAYRHAIARCEKLSPGSRAWLSGSLNELAWLLAASPDSRSRAARSAVELADEGRRAHTEGGKPLEHAGRGALPGRRLEGRCRGAGEVRWNFARAATASTGSSWPWPTGSSATSRKRAPGTTRPSHGWRRTSPRMRNSSASAPRLRPCWG